MELSATDPIYILDPPSKTIRPARSEGDDYFGLGPGTNGTAAITRRALVQPEGFTWVRFNRTPATGLQLIPGDSSESLANPWSGFP